MKLRKVGKLKPGFVIKDSDGNLYKCVWDAASNSTVIKDKEFLIIYIKDYEVVGKIGVNYKLCNKALLPIENLSYCVNDVYEIKDKKGKVIDVLLISHIDKTDNVYTYHIIHKNGSVQKLSFQELILMGINYNDKKFLSVHYEVIF